MSHRSYNQRDANQDEIVAELRDRGALVVEIEHPVDLLVGYNGFWVPVEVKSSRKAKIQPSQRKFRESCQAKDLGCVFLFSLEDVEYWFPRRFSAEKNPVVLTENPGTSHAGQPDSAS